MLESFHFMARSFYSIFSGFQTVYLGALRFCRLSPLPGTVRGQGSGWSDPKLPTTLMLKGKRIHWRILTRNWAGQILNLQRLLWIENEFEGTNLMTYRNASRRWSVQEDREKRKVYEILSRLKWQLMGWVTTASRREKNPCFWLHWKLWEFEKRGI